MDEEYLGPEQMKRLAIGAVTAALNARALESSDERMTQFASDWKMLLTDTNGTDVYRLASLLADLASSLVQHLALLLGSDSEQVMQYLAQQMYGTPITEVGEDD